MSRRKKAPEWPPFNTTSVAVLRERIMNRPPIKHDEVSVKRSALIDAVCFVGAVVIALTLWYLSSVVQGYLLPTLAEAHPEWFQRNAEIIYEETGSEYVGKSGAEMIQALGRPQGNAIILSDDGQQHAVWTYDDYTFEVQYDSENPYGIVVAAEQNGGRES